ncbi:hypothetical protein [Phascolarctobacterium succinatutens]|uniref:hypothetical protein n=1 Tax=Phascolarctobacterium succinatutens TaxID=626940 RepID=UPI004029EF4A
MAVGLQVYKADGSLDLDLTKRIPKFIGVKTVTGTGQLLISEVADNPNNKLWYIISSYTPSEDKGSIPLIRISDAGSKFQWSNIPRTTFRYGVY